MWKNEKFTLHSVEKASNLLSQYSAKFEEKFRQIKLYPSQALIYYIKCILKNENSAFLRKFAQGFLTDFNRGGFKLHSLVEISANHC